MLDVMPDDVNTCVANTVAMNMFVKDFSVFYTTMSHKIYKVIREYSLPGKL